MEREGGKGAEKPILGREKGGKQILRGGWGRKGEGEIFIRDPTKFFRRNLHHSEKVAETMKKSNVPFRGKEGKNKRMICLSGVASPPLACQTRNGNMPAGPPAPIPLLLTRGGEEPAGGGKRRKEPLFIYLPLYL